MKFDEPNFSFFSILGSYWNFCSVLQPSKFCCPGGFLESYPEYTYILGVWSYLIDIPHQTGTFTTFDDPTLTHIIITQSSQSTVQFTLGVAQSIGLDKIHNIYAPLQNHIEFDRLHCPKNPPFSTYPSLPPKPLATTDLFTISIILPFQNVIQLASYSIQPFQVGFFHLMI